MILDEIVAYKKLELANQKIAVPIKRLKALIDSRSACVDFGAALKGNGVKLIAEVKKASPSKGLICRDFDPLVIARRYAENGAAAISILTESHYFRGDLNYLAEIRAALGEERPPLLRKDFIFDPYQIYESRANGADALLLITAILDFTQLKDLLELSHQLGIQCLVETHNEDEVARALAAEAQIIGINNRDLKTFEEDLNTTSLLCSLIPKGRIIVSESGIKTRGDMQKLQKWGVNAALMGETLMKAPDIGSMMKELYASG